MSDRQDTSEHRQLESTHYHGDGCNHPHGLTDDELRREVICSMSVPAVDDERLRYAEVQIDRDLWLQLVERGMVPRA